MSVTVKSPSGASTTTTISGRQFNQDRSAAKRLAAKGPVIITDRGRPAHVLMSFEEYRRLSGSRMSLLEALAQPGADGDDYEIPKLPGPLFKRIDLD